MTPGHRPRLSLRRKLAAVALGCMAAACSPLALAAPACVEQRASIPAPSLPGGIGGTGDAAHGGIGGTGAIASGGRGGTGDAANGGIGGTGAIADGGIGGTGDRAEGGIGGTGIVGTVTGFASVCVNGLEVHYDAATPVTRNGLPATTETLALGQVIAIDAARAERGLVARRIGILNVLEGPITAAAPENGMIEVMGQPIRVDASTRLGGLPSLAEARPGMPLRVAGFRAAGGEIHATRIEMASDRENSSAIGALARPTAGEASLGGLPVRATTPLPVAGGEVLLRGHWDGRHLLAREALPDPSQPFVGHADHVVAEGLVLEHRDPVHLRINGFQIELSAATRITGDKDSQFVEGQRIRVSGRLEGKNRIVAEGIEAAGLPQRDRPSSAPPPRGRALSGERAAITERMGNPDHPDHPDHPDRLERPDRPDRPDRMERLERIPLPKPERPSGAERPRMRM